MKPGKKRISVTLKENVLQKLDKLRFSVGNDTYSETVTCLINDCYHNEELEREYIFCQIKERIQSNRCK